MNAARQRILDRVRRALTSQAHQPAPPTDAPIFSPVTAVEKRFCDEFTALRGELLPDAAALQQFVSGFARIASAVPDRVTGNAAVREAELGVTGCDYLVAQTGSIIVSTRSAGGRALSVLPPVHLVIAARTQLVPDLAAALRLLRQRYQGHWPSALSVMTGPSRTADIEKILVMGAHGPKRLVVYWTD